MWLFTVKVLQEPEVIHSFWGISREGWAIIAQWANALAIAFAAFVAAQYPKKKDKLERKNTSHFIHGRITVIWKKSEVFLSFAEKIKMKYPTDVVKQLINLAYVIEAFKIRDDLKFFTDNSEIINSFIISSVLNPSDIAMNLNWLIYWLDEEAKLHGEVTEGEIAEFLKGMMKSLNDFNSDFKNLNKELEVINLRN